MKKLIKVGFDSNYKILIETFDDSKTIQSKTFNCSDDFLVWFVNTRKADLSLPTQTKVCDPKLDLRFLIFRGSAPYTKLRQLLITCNTLSQVYKIPIAGYDKDGKQSRFSLQPVAPNY